jgi:hypothetical protein
MMTALPSVRGGAAVPAAAALRLLATLELLEQLTLPPWDRFLGERLEGLTQALADARLQGVAQTG